MRRVDRAGQLRDLVGTASSINARMVAAAVGGHLARLDDAGLEPDVQAAAAALRDATLALLTDLHRGHAQPARRAAALRSVDALEHALARIARRSDPAANDVRSRPTWLSAVLKWPVAARAAARSAAATALPGSAA